MSRAPWLGWLHPLRWLTRLLPRRDRSVVLRELDDLARRRRARRGARLTGLWYVGQVLSFALWLRVERVRLASGALRPLWADLLVTVRSLVRRPGYLVAGVLTLGVGAGGVALTYGAAHWLTLRDVPGVTRPDDLVWVRLESNDAESWGARTWGILHPDYERLRDRLTSVVGFEAARELPVHLGRPGGGAPSRETASMVTPGYFEMLAMEPAAGRFFAPEDHVGAAGPSEVVIADELWRRVWNRSPRAMGAELLVNGRPFVVVGVATRGFRGAELPGVTDLWLTTSAFATLRPAEAERGLAGSVQLWNRLIGRRAAGASVDDVQRQANAVIDDVRTEGTPGRHSFMASHFVFRAYEGIGLEPGRRAEVRRTLGILSAGALLLLVLAVANVATLGLTRVVSRRGRNAIRRALGAGVRRVASEPLFEGAVMGALGGVLAAALLTGSAGALRTVALAGGSASLEGLTIQPEVVLVTLAVAMLGGLASGFLPAVSTRRQCAWGPAGAARGTDPRSGRARAALVVGQVALSGGLVVGAGLFGRTAAELNAIDLGVSRDAYTFTVDPGLNDYGDAEAREVLSRVRERMSSRLGGDVGGIVFPALMDGWRVTGRLRPQDVSEEKGVSGSTVWTSGNDAFAGLGLELLAGPGFRQDLRSPPISTPPVVLNESMARAAFPGRPLESIVGARVSLGGDDGSFRVAGVVADARLVGPLQNVVATVFRPWDTSWSEGAGSFVLRSPMSPAVTRGFVDDLVRTLDPALPVYDAATLGDKADVLLSGSHLLARIAAWLGVIGLALASLGLYGVLAYAVDERTRELGIRAALGASTSALRATVLGKGLALAALGLFLGLPAGWWASQLVESRLYGIATLDPATYGGAAALLLGVAFLASWLPARRATRVSPVEALRAP